MSPGSWQQGRHPVALVTGAASGLGRATAAMMAADGATVVCVDRDAAGLDTTVDAIGAAGGHARALTCDVADEESVVRAIAAVADAEGRLDALVNAAGIARREHAARTSLRDWNRQLDVNLTGTFLVTREALPLLVASRGCVVNVASIAALRGWPYMAAYAASKGGVVALTRALAVEFGRQGVRVNCVCPGSIETPMAAGLGRLDDVDPALAGRAAALVDPPRASPEEVARTVTFLCSPDARFVTGAVHVVDGGVTA